MFVTDPSTPKATADAFCVETACECAANSVAAETTSALLLPSKSTKGPP
jgi:hypothetical protein